MANEVREIDKRSDETFAIQVQYQPSSTSTFRAYNLAATTAKFVLSQTLGGVPLFEKSSADATELVFTNALSGEMEVYINKEDTVNLKPGIYYYTLYSTDPLSKQRVVKTDKIIITESVKT